MAEDLRLSDLDEQGFQDWYAGHAAKWGLNPNPDDPEHYYDYRAAYRAGAKPNEEGHWPSQFKLEGHPRLILEGVDTRTGQRLSDIMTPEEMDALSARTPDPSTYLGPIIWESGQPKAGMRPLPGNTSGKPQVYPDREAPPQRNLYGRPKR